MPRCPTLNSKSVEKLNRFFALDGMMPRADSLGGPTQSRPAHGMERLLATERCTRNEPFFPLLLSLINNSCPIPNVDLVWAEPDADENPFGRARTSEIRSSHRFDQATTTVRPFFEDLAPAAQARGADRGTEAAYIQRSKYGLIHLAVPVAAGGRHFATLQTGQVLTAPPAETDLAQIGKDAMAMETEEVERLQQAYCKVPVVSQEDLRRTAEMLQVVAGFLATSLAQTIEAAREQQRKGRELRLVRQEFVYLALGWPENGGGEVAAKEITGIQRRIGFRHSPNRILVVRPELDEGNRRSYPVTPLEAIEKLCDKLDEVAAVSVEASSICVFLRETGLGGNSAQKIDSRRLAARILHEIRETCNLGARIGVGRPKEDWRGLAESYREACLAVAASDQAIMFYEEPSGSLDDLSLSVEDLCRAIGENRFEEAEAAIAALPELVSGRLGARKEELAFARLFFSFAMESVSMAAQKLGCNGSDLESLCAAAAAEFKRGPGFSQLEATWRRCAVELLERAGQLYAGKRQQIVRSACRTIQSGIEQGSAQDLSLSAVAAGLGVSVSHMSRTFKRETGQTFEQYVITRRVNFAKRLLRDPLHNVSEVAAQSGFSDPSYFARVFRKLVGCSPREYCANPNDAGAHAPGHTSPTDVLDMRHAPSLDIETQAKTTAA